MRDAAMLFRRIGPLMGLALLATCSEPATQPPPPPLTTAKLSISLVGPAYISTVSIEVRGAGIDSVLVFNFSVVSGSASGSIEVPAGAGRAVTARAFDVTGVNTHRADTTVTLVGGNNPPINLLLIALNGDAPIVISFGTGAITLSRSDTSLNSGDTLRYGASVTDPRGNPDPGAKVRWASTNPAVVAIDSTGLALARSAGTAKVVATYRGIASARSVTVIGADLSDCLSCPVPPPLAPEDMEVVPTGTLARTSSGSDLVGIAVNPLRVDGVTVENLNPSQVVVIEDNVVKGFLLEQVGTIATTKADIVVVMDVTGSMSEEIDGVRNSVLAFASSLAATGFDLAMGAVAYEDDRSTPHADISTGFGATNSAFRTTVANWGAGGGDDIPENALRAITFAADSMSWRPGAQRIMVLITDAEIHTANSDCNFSGPCTSETLASTSAKLHSGSAATTVYVVSPSKTESSGVTYKGFDNNSDGVADSFGAIESGTLHPVDLATATGGQWIQLRGNGNVDLSSIGFTSTLSKSWKLTFRTASLAAGTHNVRIRFTISATANGELVFVSVVY